jgi:hypothetical protein
MRSVLVLFILWVLCGLLSGCFSTREPDKPQGPAEFVSPTSPEVLLDNVSKAMGSLNVVNFQRCFNANRYKFIPEPTIGGNNVGNFARWTFNDESVVMNNLKNKSVKTPNNKLAFSQITPPSYKAPDSVEYSVSYVLQLNHQDLSYSPTEFRGNSNFTIIQQKNNEWVIVQWQDNKNSSFPCWTDLKQHFIAP